MPKKKTEIPKAKQRCEICKHSGNRCASKAGICSNAHFEIITERK